MGVSRRTKLLFLAFLVTFFTGSIAAVSTFGSTQGTLPELSDIRIYDVTGDVTKKTGGELIAQGVNKTFFLNQSGWKYYRFTFEVVNNGDSSWSLENSDDLFHNSLDSSWSIDTNDIWYNISGSEYHSGSFSSGTVNWDTSQGGSVNPGEKIYAKYLINISSDTSQTYNPRFEVNDTSNSSGSYDQHKLDLNRIGYLDLQLDQPPQDTVIGQNRSFILNGTVNCLDGECGKIDASARYNKSSEADTNIPEDSAKPFHTIGQNTKQCGDLGEGSSCQISWDVNATGSLESYHLLDFNASSSTYNSISENDSEDHLIQINEVFLINVTWDTTDFGALDPGKQNISAPGNSNQKYNLTVEDSSDSVDRLWTRATDLTSTSNDYMIGASNLSYSLTNDISTEERYSNSYSLVDSDIPAGEILSFFFWIDMPTGILQDDYSGTLYFKANNSG